MAVKRAVLVVDGHTYLDDTLDQWHKRPPDLLADLVKQGAARKAGIHAAGPGPQPWLVAAAMAITNATLTSRAVHVDVKTHIDGWTIDVNHPH